MDVISVHVPKSAGSTFGNFLTSIYGMDQVFKDYDDYPMNPLSRFNLDRENWKASAAEQVRAIGSEFQAIHGHFAIEKYSEVFPEARRIAWVRHPAAWVISLYYFWKNGPKIHSAETHPLIRRLHGEDLSLLDFAEDPSVRDRISQVFLRGLPPESFDFLGIQEHFGDDLRDMIDLMNWPEVPAGFENRSPEPGYQDKVRQIHQDPSVVDRLVALNEKDMAFYEQALDVRSRRLKAHRAGASPQSQRAAIRLKLEPDQVTLASRVA